MAFIMQNDDDMSSHKVQQRLMAEWNTMLRRVQGKIFNCKNFIQIQKMVETEQLSYKGLSILTLMVPNLNEEGLGQIDNNLDLFTQIL